MNTLVLWVFAQTGPPTLEELRQLSLAELLNVPVTSVTLKETPLFDSPAAVAVLSHKEVQESGATTLADALRLVPGLHIGAVNSSQYAISARGFSSVIANKMLVLVDGRAVYSPLFAGVFWDLQQPILEDIDRIEVIRGPGGSIWGANAMNGVINVVRRDAAQTMGGVVFAGGGNVHEAMVGGRYGGRLGDDLYYRVFAAYRTNDDYLLPTGVAASDGWHSWHGGFRLDYEPDNDTLYTWQADTTILDVYDGASSAYNFNTLGRFTKHLEDRSHVEVQAYYDRTSRDEASRAEGLADTFDLRFEHGFGMGDSHDVVWGLGYRFIRGSVAQTNPLLLVRQDDFELNLFSLFVQDEWRVLQDQLTLTSGIKVEHNDYTGFEVQPTIRATFKPTDRQTLWAAVSRAVRTPSAVEGRDIFGVPIGAPFPGPGGVYLPTVTGNANPAAEVLWAYELGYRLQVNEDVSVDAAAFYNNYTDLLGIGSVTRFVPGVPVGTAEVPFRNLLSGQTYGGELTVTVTPTERWRLSASYSMLLAHFDGPAAANPAALEDSMPTHQGVVRSSHDLTKRLSVDIQLRAVDQITGVPAYVTADARLLYRITETLDLSIVGQNLFADQHLEQSPQILTVTTEVPRGVYGKLTWRF